MEMMNSLRASSSSNLTGFSWNLDLTQSEDIRFPTESPDNCTSTLRLASFLTTKIELGDIFEDIIDRISTFSFKEDVFLTYPLLMGTLQRALPKMHEEIIERSKFNDVTISIALTIATELWGENVGKFYVLDERRLAFEAAFLMLFVIFGNNVESLTIDMDALEMKYPEFIEQAISVPEKYVLLDFRNFMSVAQHLIGAKQHKNHLLDLITRVVEGHAARCVCGSGQRDEASLRALIFRREGNVPLVRKTPKKLSTENDAVVPKPAGGKRTTKKRANHLKYLKPVTVARQKGLQDIRKHAVAVTSTSSTSTLFVPETVPVTSHVTAESQTSSAGTGLHIVNASCFTTTMDNNNTIWGSFYQMENIRLFPTSDEVSVLLSSEPQQLLQHQAYHEGTTGTTASHPLSLSLSQFASFAEEWGPSNADQNKSCNAAVSLFLMAACSLSDSMRDATDFTSSTSIHEMFRGISAQPSY